MSRVLPRNGMTSTKSIAEQLLACYWLTNENEYEGTPLQQLERFIFESPYTLPLETIREAAKHLDGNPLVSDIDSWVTFVCFLGHPGGSWNFMLNAMEFAVNDAHLEKVATWLAEHLLAHYGSLLPDFEQRAADHPQFKRMLTGVWRHRMSDNVWMRLRELQAEVSNPLSTMIPLDRGLDYMADSLSPEDRKDADKGKYFLDERGSWELRPTKKKCSP